MTVRRARVRVRRLDAGAAVAVLLLLGAAVAMAAPGDGGRGHGHGPPTPAPTGAPPSPTASPQVDQGIVAGRVTVSPIAIVIELSQRAARAGQPVQVRATLTNVSLQTVDAVVEIHADPADLDVRPSAPRSVGKLPAGASQSVTWIACGRHPATYTLVAKAWIDTVVLTSTPVPLVITSTGAC
jgi:hypothetical protein